MYDKLIKAGLMIPHTEADSRTGAGSRDVDDQQAVAFKILQPERVPFISYPYEWSFGQLKDAALATLSIQKRALKTGMSLKDASAYNIQYLRGRPILIDSLSFETYRPGRPWDAYRQFCQHFLAPLALMAHVDVRLGHLLRNFIDGIPLDLASRLLPFRTRTDFGLLTHIHIHAGAQSRYADADVKSKMTGREISQNAFLGLIESLEKTIQKLNWKPAGTEWGNYYQITNYSDIAFDHKKELVTGWVQHIHPALVWDLGANTGVFSRIASQAGAYTVSFDIDPAAVEQNYRIMKSERDENLLPLQLDLTNPSPALGWAHRERDSLEQRAPADLVLALAVIHHLAISNNVPLPQLAEFFAKLSKRLVIEFVPKSDSQVRKLLLSRTDIFDSYTREGFEAAFGEHFEIREKEAVRDSERFIYLMESR